MYRFMLRSAQLLTDGYADGLMLSEFWRSIQQATRWLRRRCILGLVDSTIEQYDRMDIYTTCLVGQWPLELTTKQAHQRPSISSNNTHQPEANMKLAALSALVSLALASPIFERATPQCSVQGVRGRIPDSTVKTAFKRIAGIKTAELCNAECKLPENKQCKAFTVRTSGGGACLLYSAPVGFKSDPENTVVIFNLPEGVRGGTPHNNPAW